MSNYEYKTGHPILGVILGLLGIAAAVLLAYLTGVIGGGVALLFGVIALILGIKSRKGGRGIAAIVAGLLAVVLAVIMTFTGVATVQTLRDKAIASKPDSLVAKYADKPYLGVLGIVINIPKDEGSLEQLTAEMDALKLTENANGSQNGK